MQRRRRTVPSSIHSDLPPSIYFLTPDHPEPAGGIQVIYRHVDLLNASGTRAFVVHQRHGFRCKWFDNDTAIVYGPDVSFSPVDLVVVPEVEADLLERLDSRLRWVLFNQNAHLTFSHPPAEFARLLSTGGRCLGIVTVSDHNARMLGHIFRDTAIHRVHISVDPKLFYPDDRRRRLLTYMPRRAGSDARQVLEILRIRGVLSGWDVIALDGMSHSAIAALLRQSQLFLSFTYQEGFGLPAAEAMAAGNYVVGYHGFAGLEFFHPEFSAPVETGDVVGFANAVEEAVRQGDDWRREQGRRAAAYIHSVYSSERERTEVASLYTALLHTPTGCCPRADRHMLATDASDAAITEEGAQPATGLIAATGAS